MTAADLYFGVVNALASVLPRLASELEFELEPESLSGVTTPSVEAAAAVAALTRRSRELEASQNQRSTFALLI